MLTAAARRRRTPLRITLRDVGVHVGSVATLRYRKSGHLIHTTDPRPYGCHHAVYCDAVRWAIDHGYLEVPEWDAVQRTITRGRTR